MDKKISFFSLVALIVAAIDNMKNLPAVALFGSNLIPFFLLAAFIFLIPTALVSAELAATFPEQGGIYHWVGRAFGKKWGMAAIWLQWINTMVWYPTMLAFIAGTFAYLINPELAQNKTYLVCAVLTIFWILTWINLKGLRVSSLINNVLATMGMAFPLLLLIVLGMIWILSGHPLNIDLKIANLVPQLDQKANWTSLIAVMASFLGMELASVHIHDIHQPQKKFPRAVLCACVFILFTMMLGALSVAIVLPSEEINLVSGVMQVFINFFHAFGLESLTPILIILIVFGSFGTLINWIISPAKGLFDAAQDGFLPTFLMKQNKAGVASNILFVQAAAVSFFSLFFLLTPNVDSYFWFLTALSTELYMMMYILMFCAALTLRHPAKLLSVFKIPGGICGLWMTCGLGLIGCTTTIIVSFFPPENVDIESSSRYLILICIGNAVAISPLCFFFSFARKKRTVSEVEFH